MSVSHLNDQFDQSLLYDLAVGASRLKRGHSGEQGGLRVLMRGGERLHLALPCALHTGELLVMLLPLLLMLLLPLLPLLLQLVELQPQLVDLLLQQLVDPLLLLLHRQHALEKSLRHSESRVLNFLLGGSDPPPRVFN